MDSDVEADGDGGPPDVATLAAARRAEAVAANQRRLLVLSGARERGFAAACEALTVVDGSVAVLTTDEGEFRRVVRDSPFDAREVSVRSPNRASDLLGVTADAVVLDCHEEWSPNALGRVVGAVDGGGLFVLVVPPLSEWPDRRDDFDAGLAVPPFSVADVTGRFRRRLVSTFDHPGVAVVDVDRGSIERDGALDSESIGGGRTPTVPRRHRFPRAAYTACLTLDQSRAVAALEALADPGSAVVVEADRGRGKSNAAGLAAGSLAAAGRDVLVTAPGFENCAEVFDRATALLCDLGAFGGRVDEPGARGDGPPRHEVRAASGGRVRYAPPTRAVDLPDDPDVVLVDEAAALPVRVLERLLAAPAAGFCTTVHGYEGAGRGFSVRFRDRLDESGLRVREVHLDDPIRYARGDPVESWSFRALLLDARPPVDELVADATPETVRSRRLAPDDLVDDEHLLREVFGLLVFAHYRTEPDDLARLLDAPNLSVRALTHGGHVVSVALVAREGGLDAETRAAMYGGGRVRGNMIPDVLTSQLRDEEAGVPVGHRILRIATHHAVRSRGLGSRLLASVRGDVAGDWLGAGFGATPDLLRFWERNGYAAVYLSTSRNEASGEYSAVMLHPLTEVGRDLAERHTDWFLARTPNVLCDPLCDLDPDVARAALGTAAAVPDLDLTEREWRVVVDAADGPGLYTADPTPFKRLALRALVDGVDVLDARAERLLVRKVLQAHPWPAVSDELGYVSPRQCMRALGDAYVRLLDVYGDERVESLRTRYE